MERRRFIMEKTEQLPMNYTPVNYLQSSGTQYIDTGFKLNQDSDVTIDMQVISYNQQAGLFGARESATKNNLAAFNTWQPTSITCDFENHEKHRVILKATTNRIKIRINKNGLWLDGVQQKSWSDVADFETPVNGLIFDVGNNNWTGNKAIMRLYGYKEGANLNLVPCLDIDGKPCLYDTIHQTALYNMGTGSFTWG